MGIEDSIEESQSEEELEVRSRVELGDDMRHVIDQGEGLYLCGDSRVTPISYSDVRMQNILDEEIYLSRN